MPNSQKATKLGHFSKPILATIIATVLLIIFIVVALLLAPGDTIPEFSITDQNGDWDAQDQGKIAVFNDKIHPDAKGEYKFIIKNETAETLMYGFRLSEYLGNLNVDADPFMMYRIKTDNIYLGDGEYHFVGANYAEIEILPGSEHIMTLEWWWPFELDKEHDANDTLVGIAGGKLSVHIFIWAEVVPEEIW